MRLPGLVLAFLALAACAKETNFPTDFAGRWTYDSEEIEKRIKVTKEGVWTFDDMPENLKLQLRVIEKRNGGYILETTNTLNPVHKQYTFNRIENGIWVVKMLNEELVAVEGIEDDRWKQTIKE